MKKSNEKMTYSDIATLMVTHKLLGGNNNQAIRNASPRKIALTIASFFMFRREKIKTRAFDNLWENGRTDEIKREFTKLYNEIPELRFSCRYSDYFSQSMIETNN